MRYLITYTRSKMHGAVSETITEIITSNPINWWDSATWTDWGVWDECIILMVHREEEGDGS